VRDSLLGKVYHDGEVIARQGEWGDCMYVVQQGRVEIVLERADGSEPPLDVVEQGDLFGEMAILEKQRRSATVRARGEARVLTVDRRTFLRRVKEDPTLALNLLRSLSHRLRHMNRELEEARAKLRSAAA
jgi:CRP-like cAMP-binding protein